MRKVWTSSVCGLLIAAAALTVGAAHAEAIMITEVDLANDRIELVNDTGGTIDMSTWWLCNRVNGVPFYQTLTTSSAIDVGLSSPGASYASFGDGQTLVLDVMPGFLPDINGELGLYTTNSFASAAAIVDYVLWGANGIRDFVAETAGLWVDNASIDVSGIGAGETLQSLPGTTGNGPSEWTIGPGTLGSGNLSGITGDLDNDGFVGIADLNIILGDWNQTVPPADPAADPSGDSFVGIEDLNTVLGNWNAGTPPAAAAVPEPTTMMLLGLGLLGLARRRR